MARGWFRGRVAQPPGPAGPERLLIVRVDERVGNLITQQSLIDAIRIVWPRIELGLLASTRAARIVASLDGLDRRHLLDKRWFFSRPARWRGCIRAVRSAAYQVALDASAWHEFSFTHAALTYYSGAPIRIGYLRGRASAFHSHSVEPGPAGEYELSQRMRLLVPLGPEIQAPVLRTRLGLESQARFGEWFQSLRVERPRIGLWAGARKPQRRWPVPYFVQLGRKLQRRFGARLVVLWGPGEEALRDELAAAIDRDLVVAPATGIEDLAGLIRGLDLMVTNDTGPMHLAVACAVPTLALFASGDPGRWGHPGAGCRSLRCPGRDPAEVDQAADAGGQLLLASASRDKGRAP
jgi:ADP-heptose:LPS heptosyltransferase